MAETGYVNEAVRSMYGIPYHQLTAEQKRILHADSMRRAKLIEERQQAVLLNNLKAFEEEARMEKVLASIYAQCQKDIIADVTETIAKVKKAGGEWSYANQSALTRSRGLFEQIAGELNKLGQKEQILFTQGLSNIYTDQFLRQVYTLGQTIPVKANFNRLNPALIQKTLDYPWSGAMFSDRIWQDKATLGRNLRVGLTQSMVLGESIPQIADRINKGIDTSKYNAERLARTETKRVTYCAHDDAYEDMGVEELEYRCANGGDHRTCKICLADNKKHYKRGEEPTLPRHPNCRCVYIPVVSDEFGDNELNELTGSIRGAENYEKWKQHNEKSLKDLSETDKDDIITDRTNHLYPDNIAGVEKGKSMDFDEADEGRANPNFSSGGGYTINCQSCVVTNEARRRGYDVQTLANKKGSMAEILSRDTDLAWIDPVTGEKAKGISIVAKTATSAYKQMNEIIEDGGRYTFSFGWKRYKSGHIICADKKDGNVRLFDPQSGRMYEDKDKIVSYLERISVNIKTKKKIAGIVFEYPEELLYKLRPKLLRVDNLMFNLEVVNQIMKGV